MVFLIKYMGGGLLSSCVECEVTITEPICPSCLTDSMRVMVAEEDQDMASGILEDIPTEAGISCLFCGELMNRCAHCISKDIYLFIRDRNPGLAEEFMSRFDFDLRRTFA